MELRETPSAHKRSPKTIPPRQKWEGGTHPSPWGQLVLLLSCASYAGAPEQLCDRKAHGENKEKIRKRASSSKQKGQKERELAGSNKTKRLNQGDMQGTVNRREGGMPETINRKGRVHAGNCKQKVQEGREHAGNNAKKERNTSGTVKRKERSMPGSFRHEKTTSDHRWVMSLSRQAEEGNIRGAINTLSIKEGNTPGTMNRKVENMAESIKTPRKGTRREQGATFATKRRR